MTRVARVMMPGVPHHITQRGNRWSVAEADGSGGRVDHGVREAGLSPVLGDQGRFLAKKCSAGLTGKRTWGIFHKALQANRLGRNYFFCRTKPLKECETLSGRDPGGGYRPTSSRSAIARPRPALMMRS